MDYKQKKILDDVQAPERAINLSETQLRHLIHRRWVVFADEWLTYFTLIFLYFTIDIRIFAIILAIGIYLNYIGYRNLDQLRRRHGIDWEW